ncbi:MAG: ATP-binding protein [Planctomycetia bacterium]|nr:ATP-binding protein [Planctomycetia bacterium]
MADTLGYEDGSGQSTEDWDTILRRGFESKELDYKGPDVWDEGNKKACCEIVKDILAIANTKGGFLVFGVSETSNGLFSWDGLTDEQCKSFEATRLNNWVQKYADPPINAHVIKHPSQGSRFVIIEIPRFSDTPHICQKDYPGVLAAGTVYVRTDNNESAPIKDSSDMRAIVEQAVRNRGDQLLTSFRAILTGAPQLVSGPRDIEQFDAQIRDAASRSKQLLREGAETLGFRETVFHPMSFERLRFTIPDLENMAAAACVTYRGWPYLFYTKQRADCISHLDDGLEMRLDEQGTFQFWRLHQSGCLYVNEMFHEDGRPESTSTRVLGTIGFTYTCAEAVQCLVDLYTGRLHDNDVVRLHIRLSGVRGRRLARTPAGHYQPMEYECEADRIDYDQKYKLADWRASVIPRAVDLLRHVYEEFRAPPPSENDAGPLMLQLFARQL